MVRPETFGQDPMTKRFWWSCPYDCGEAHAGLHTAHQAYRDKADHVAICAHRPGPEPPRVAPPPVRPV